MNIDEKTIKHVAKLAQIDIESKLELYKNEFNELLKSIDRINEIEIDTNEIMISPIKVINRFNELDVEKVEAEKIFKDALGNNNVTIQKVIE